MCCRRNAFKRSVLALRSERLVLFHLAIEVSADLGTTNANEIAEADTHFAQSSTQALALTTSLAHACNDKQSQDAGETKDLHCSAQLVPISEVKQHVHDTSEHPNQR